MKRTKAETKAQREPGRKMYGIVYGGEGRCDYDLDGEYATVAAARAAYRPKRRVRYADGLLGGADVPSCARRTVPWGKASNGDM